MARKSRFSSEEMGPRDRLLLTIRGGKADRVPLALEGFSFATRAEIDAHGDPRQREIAHRVFDHTHYRVMVDSGDNRYLRLPRQSIREVLRVQRDGEIEFTHEIRTPGGPLTAITARNPVTDTVWTKKYPVESLEDIEKIRSVPWELPHGVRAADLSGAKPDFARRGIARVGVSSPFVCVAGMMSYQRFLELCATELPLLKELSALCLDRTLAVLDVVLAGRNVDYVWVGGCEWLTPPMGSPRLYEELVQEFEKPVIDRVHAGGAVCHVHCHGRVRSTLEQVIRRGGDFFEPVEPPPNGDITFAEAKAIAAGRITLGGNVEARVIETEDAATAEAACRAAFEGPRERMVFQTSAGPVGPMTQRTLKNYNRMIDVWEELSAL